MQRVFRDAGDCPIPPHRLRSRNTVERGVPLTPLGSWEPRLLLIGRLRPGSSSPSPDWSLTERPTLPGTDALLTPSLPPLSIISFIRSYRSLSTLSHPKCTSPLRAPEPPSPAHPRASPPCVPQSISALRTPEHTCPVYPNASQCIPPQRTPAYTSASQKILPRYTPTSRLPQVPSLATGT